MSHATLVPTTKKKSVNYATIAVRLVMKLANVLLVRKTRAEIRRTLNYALSANLTNTWTLTLAITVLSIVSLAIVPPTAPNVKINSILTSKKSAYSVWSKTTSFSISSIPRPAKTAKILI